MAFNYEQGIDIKQFIAMNQEQFEARLFIEADQVKEIIQEVKDIGSIDLIGNAYKLVELMIDQNQAGIIDFAQHEGQLWAQHSSLNLAVKLEWFQSIRRVLWEFMYNFDLLAEKDLDREDFFSLERQINPALDTFLRHFFMTYTMFKDALIEAHKEMIDDLSVPIIPVTSRVSILPLLGAIDIHRTIVIQEKVLQQIGSSNVRTLLIDMSGVAILETDVVKQLFKIIEGVSFMGCTPIITGIRYQIASKMVELNVSLTEKVMTKGSLQQALEDLGLTIAHA